jgi:dTDP-glucose 4,6-dehydratase
MSDPMRFKNAVVFVTGGAGFIGSAVIRHLLNDTEAFVVNVDKLTYASSLSSTLQVATSQRYRLTQVDISNAHALRKIFDQYGPQYVMNLAAETHVDRSIDHASEFITTNVVGTFTLLQETLRYWRTLHQAAQARFRFHHISTDEVYGSLDHKGLFSEVTAYAPSSPYAASKAASDHLVRAWRTTYGLPTLVTNCSNNYGPYQFPEKLVPHIIIKGLAEEPLPVYGDGQNVRDWLYVEDHARALSLVLERGIAGETYNIGGRNECTNITMVKRICALLDDAQPARNGPRENLITFAVDRPGHDRRYAIDCSKIEREIGWRAIETFETGLSKTVRWYLDNHRWWQDILDRGYKAERIGLAKNNGDNGNF